MKTRERASKWRYIGLLSACGAVLVTTPARGYTVNTPVTDGCHESLTFAALRQARAHWPPGIDQVHLAAGAREEGALLADVPFRVPGDLRDLAAITLVLANRDVDLEGLALEDIDQIATLHGDPAKQDRHCLRRPEQDGATGNAAALSACRSYIRAQIEAALDGLTADGRVNGDRLTTFEPVLDVRGPVEVALPRFQVHMGRALHAIQDSFTHAYRNADDLRVKTLLNYIEPLGDRYAEASDGPPHSIELDRCEDLDTFRDVNLTNALEASTAFLTIALGPENTREVKMMRIDQLLDGYYTLAPGCAADNQWCGSPERRYATAAFGCTVAAPRDRSRGHGVPWAAAALLLVIARGRRRLAIAIMLLVSLAAMPMAAAETPAPARTGLFVSGAFAAQNLAGALSAGLRYRLDERFVVGLDGEWNPWISENTGQGRAGTLNVYGTTIVRYPLRYEAINLRSTMHLGVSRILFDLYGVPEGSTGLFVGFSPLGVDIALGRSIYLVIDPAFVAIPVPQLQGIPYAYPQYRFRIGLQWGA